VYGFAVLNGCTPFPGTSIRTDRLSEAPHPRNQIRVFRDPLRRRELPIVNPINAPSTIVPYPSNIPLFIIDAPRSLAVTRALTGPLVQS